nr:2B [Oscivirus A1]
GIIENTRIAAESVSYASMNLERALTQERLDKISEISKSFMLASENVHMAVDGVNAALSHLVPVISSCDEVKPLHGLAQSLVTWIVRIIGILVLLVSNFNLSTLTGVFLILSADFITKVTFEAFKDNPFQFIGKWISEKLDLGVDVDIEPILYVKEEEDPEEGPSGQ